MSTLSNIQDKSHHNSHCTVEKTEAQRGKLTQLRFDSGSVWLTVGVLIMLLYCWIILSSALLFWNLVLNVLIYLVIQISSSLFFLNVQLILSMLLYKLSLHLIISLFGLHNPAHGAVRIGIIWALRTRKRKPGDMDFSQHTQPWVAAAGLEWMSSDSWSSDPSTLPSFWCLTLTSPLSFSSYPQRTFFFSKTNTFWVIFK